MRWTKLAGSVLSVFDCKLRIVSYSLIVKRGMSITTGLVALSLFRRRQVAAAVGRHYRDTRRAAVPLPLAGETLRCRTWEQPPRGRRRTADLRSRSICWLPAP